MIHRRYLARTSEEEKIVGILGEDHFYSPEEEDFAERVISKYGVIASEMSDGLQPRDLLVIPGILILSPSIRMSKTYCNSTHVNMKQIARRNQKEMVYLNDFVRPERAILYSLLSPLLLPLGLVSTLKENMESGNPYDAGKRRHEYIDPNFSIDNLNWEGKTNCFLLDVTNRDKQMANVAYPLIKRTPEPVLINCGLLHMSGVARNLATKFDELELVDQETPKYK